MACSTVIRIIFHTCDLENVLSISQISQAQIQFSTEDDITLSWIKLYSLTKPFYSFSQKKYQNNLVHNLLWLTMMLNILYMSNTWSLFLLQGVSVDLCLSCFMWPVWNHFSKWECVYFTFVFREYLYYNPSEVFWIPKANFQKDIYNHAECLLCTFEMGEILISFSNLKLLGL